MSGDYEEDILRSLRRVTRAIDLYSRQLAKQYQLTGPQVVCIRQIQRDTPTSPGELARAISLSQATVTGILDRLLKRGLVRRERSEEDRRRVIVTLTSSGKELARTVPSPLQERFAERLAALPDENRAVISTVLQQVVRMMEAQDLDAAPVLDVSPALDGD